MNNKYNTLVFWEPIVSPHKIYFIRMIKKVNPYLDIFYCSNAHLSEDRKKLGWSIDEKDDGIKYIISPNIEEINLIISKNIENTLHIFSGIRWVESIINGIKAVKKYNADFAIMSEPRDHEGFKGFLRYIHSILTENWIKKNVKFILAQGIYGPIWYKKVGYDTNKIFPFAYFVPPLNNKSLNKGINSPINIAYIGRLTKSKGIFELANAIKSINHEYIFHIVGDGEERTTLESFCIENKINYVFHGVIENKNLGTIIRSFDLLALLSLSKDGWGVVISEALMEGVTCLVSDKVGSSYIMKNSLFGEQVSPSNRNDIVNKINKLINSDNFSEKRCRERQSLAISMLSDEAGAKYFLEILSNFKNTDLITSDFYKINK